MNLANQHKLVQFPERGNKEPSLEEAPKKYRYILYKETRHFELKMLVKK